SSSRRPSTDWPDSSPPSSPASAIWAPTCPTRSRRTFDPPSVGEPAAAELAQSPPACLARGLLLTLVEQKASSIGHHAASRPAAGLQAPDLDAVRVEDRSNLRPFTTAVEL